MANDNGTMLAGDKNDEKEAFKRRLYRIMLAKNMSQSDLAKKAGLNRNRISSYVRGESLPTGIKLKLLADALKVNPADLLPDTRLVELPPPVKVVFSPDHTKVRITVDTWLPTAIGTEIIKQIGEHAIAHGE